MHGLHLSRGCEVGQEVPQITAEVSRRHEVVGPSLTNRVFWVWSCRSQSHKQGMALAVSHVQNKMEFLQEISCLVNYLISVRPPRRPRNVCYTRHVHTLRATGAQVCRFRVRNSGLRW